MRNIKYKKIKGQTKGKQVDKQRANKGQQLKNTKKEKKKEVFFKFFQKIRKKR
jgi:hypothetical protein